MNHKLTESKEKTTTRFDKNLYLALLKCWLFLSWVTTADLPSSHPVSELSYLGISTRRLEDRTGAPGGWVL